MRAPGKVGPKYAKIPKNSIVKKKSLKLHIKNKKHTNPSQKNWDLIFFIGILKACDPNWDLWRVYPLILIIILVLVLVTISYIDIVL